MIIDKNYPGKKWGNYHPKRVRINCHYFVVMENGKLPPMPLELMAQMVGGYVEYITHTQPT